MASSIGTAYLTLVPKMKDGWQNNVSSSVNGITPQIGKAGGSAGSSFAASFGSMAKAGAIAAATAIAAGLGAAVKSAFTSYADYEQLIGGVETLFGDASDKVEYYARQAYASAGMTANEYMETVTGFSAALLQSMGGNVQEAADMADTAIRDMADNANKMGSDMASIQNAYQGFAKQNYTMLDNLKLGYGGTKSEMERLIADANKLAEAQGLAADMSIENYDDIIRAIHIVQTEMGITGTTAKEANQTISGSIASTKSAFMNLVTDLGSGGEHIKEDLAALGEQFGYMAQNVINVAGNIFSNIGTLIAEQLPVLVENIVNYVQEHGPDMLNAAIDFLLNIVTGIAHSIPKIMGAVPGIVLGIVQTLWERKGDIFNAGVDLIAGLIDGIKARAEAVVDCIKEICKGALDAVKRFFGIKSPSRVMKQMGNYIGEGMALGIEETEDDISKAWDSAVGGIGDVTASIGADGAASRGTVYNIGDVSLNVSDLKDIVTIEQLANMLRRAKGMGAAWA